MNKMYYLIKPVSFIKSIDNKHDGSCGAEEKSQNRYDTNITVRTLKGQVEYYKGNATILKTTGSK